MKVNIIVIVILPDMNPLLFEGPEITLKQLSQDNSWSLKSFRIMQKLQQNMGPPPILTMLQKLDRV